MRMNLYMTRINYQPFKIGRINYYLKKLFPYPLVAPTDKTLVHRPPLAIFGRQVPPRRACSQYPEYRIDEKAIIFCYPTPLTASPW
jgi:hypothetical protein